MEKWKLAAIAALLCSFAGYGVFANSSANQAIGTGAPLPAVTPTPSPWIGKTLPAWPSIKQWVGTPAPPNLNALRGKPVLLEVFRTECPHCRDAAPVLAALHSRYAPRGVEFVGIQSPGDVKDAQNPENSWPAVQGWVKQKGYTWPVGFDAQSTWFQGQFGGKNVSYPSLFLLDKTGKVVFFQSGHDTGKAVQLAVELERIAPGQGDLNARSNDLAKWLSVPLQLQSADTQSSLQQDVLARLGAPKKVAPATSSMAPSPAMLASALLGLMSAGARAALKRKGAEVSRN